MQRPWRQTLERKSRNRGSKSRKQNGTQASKTENKAETQVNGYLKGGNEGSGKKVL
jgi:hypothetical protein